MTTIVETVRTVVSASVLRDALTATLLSAGKDDTLPVLCSVRISKQGRSLVLHSTDRYRMTRVTVTLDGGDLESPDWSFLMSAGDAKNVLVALPKPTRHGLPVLASLTVEDDALMVDTGQASLRLRRLEGEFPKVDGIIPTEGKDLGAIGLDPRFLIDLAKMPGRGKGEPVRFRFAGEGKPVISEWSSGEVAYLYLLMPVRH